MPSSPTQDSAATPVASVIPPVLARSLDAAAAVRRWLARREAPPSELGAIDGEALRPNRIVSSPASPTSPPSLFMSRQHMEALAHLRYGLETGGGVILLTGAIGTGKSALCRAFLHELPAQVQAFHLSRPGPDRDQLMIDICHGFGIEVRPGAPIRVYIDRLNAFLLDNAAQGRRTVLVVDDAQRLSPDLLEQLRLLTNLETDRDKLLQIVLVGQTGLRELLERPELRQLSQRVVARHQLGPLARDEVMAYAHHKLDDAGIPGVRLSHHAAGSLYGWTGGVPRTLDQLLDRAVVSALARGRIALDATTFSRAARDIGLMPEASTWPWGLQLAGMSLTLVLACAGAAIWMNRGPGGGVASAATGGVSSAPVAPVGTAARGQRAAGPAVAGQVSAATPAVDPAPPAALAAAGTVRAAAGQDAAAEPALPPMVALIQRWDSSAADWRGCDRLSLRLRCMTGRAQLQDLRELDLPVVLHLADDAGHRGDALLQGVADGTATLRFDDVAMRISVEELAERWRGEFTALWPSPPAFSTPLRPGDSGPAVAWLQARLSQLQPVSARRAAGTARFDAALQTRLRAFQVREHLDADGIAGIKTLVRLAQRTDHTLPRLTPRATP